MTYCHIGIEPAVRQGPFQCWWFQKRRSFGTRDQYRYLSRVNGVNTAALGMSAQNGDISQFAVAKTVRGIFQLGEVGSAKPVKI